MEKIIKISGILLVAFFAFVFRVNGQQNDSAFMYGIIEKGDTTYYKNISEITVLPEKVFKNDRQKRRYNKYVEKVKKVYPYARLAGEMLKKYEPKYLATQEEKERRRMMKELEQQLLDEYKDDLKKMSFSEGKILLKLIDRETSRTSYTLIKDFRGGVPAVFWQGIARLFGSDLKAEYDPFGEDRQLEEIVMLIEIGYL